MRYALGPPRLLHRGVGALALGTVVFVTCAGFAGLGPARSLGLLALCALLGSAAWRWIRRLPGSGAIGWDGDVWLGPDGRSWREVRLRLDLQRAMFVELRDPADGAPPRNAWLWLESSSDPAFWSALRRAVYSRAAAVPQPHVQP